MWIKTSDLGLINLGNAATVQPIIAASESNVARWSIEIRFVVGGPANAVQTGGFANEAAARTAVGLIETAISSGGVFVDLSSKI